MSPVVSISKLKLRDGVRTAWVFGAGASMSNPYNVPSQAGLLKHFMNAPGANTWVEARRGRVEAICRQVYPGWSVTDSRVALEELFAANELVRDDPRSTVKEADAARKALRDLVLAMRFAVITRGRADNAKWCPFARAGISSPYAELLERLFPSGTTDAKAHFFITLNYDVNLDRCVVNMRGSESDLDIDYGVTFANARCSRDPDVPKFDEPRDGAVLVLRPHGGLTWFRCLACRSVFTTLGRQRQIPVGGVCWACRARRVDYVLVHPSFSRRYDDPLLSSVWGRVYEELVRSDRWVFAGYSLPAADYHFRALLRDALAKRGKAATSIVLVGVKDAIDPGSVATFDSTVATYQGMFDTRLTVWEATKNGFADFVSTSIVR